MNFAPRGKIRGDERLQKIKVFSPTLVRLRRILFSYEVIAGQLFDNPFKPQRN